MNGTVDTDDVVTIGAVAKELHWPLTRTKALTDTIDPVMVVSRVKLYSRKAVQEKLREQNYNLLSFLGVRPQDESYDSVISFAVESDTNV